MVVIDSALAAKLDAELEADLQKDGRLGKPKRYLGGDHDLAYMPRGAKKEYEHLAKRSITNWTPLVPSTYSGGLFVDGFRSPQASADAEAWRFWQANGLDARQTIAHRGALEYGVSYALVLPGKLGDQDEPYFRPLSPLRSMAWYEDEDDEFPSIALRRKGTSADGTRIIELYDATSRHTFTLPKDGKAWVAGDVDEHGLGVTPFVRFRERLDGESLGLVSPLITIQDRINEVVFATLIAIQYASFRQRWATGLAIPTREVRDAEGNVTGEEAVEPFEAAVNRLWVSENPETKFGDFAQTELSGHHSAYDSAVRTLAGIARISPNILTGDLVNLSADALAQMESSTQRKIDEYKTVFGEAWESGFRLAAKAAGSTDIPVDAEVLWRDTEARALTATVEALTKMVSGLGVPGRALWERIPGVTQSDVERWEGFQEPDPLDSLTAELARQGAAATVDDADPVVEALDPADAKAKADALGSLIRAGVEPENAASQVGLEDVEFTGAVPVSLRLPVTEAAPLED